jgi:hypothetical protein
MTCSKCGAPNTPFGYRPPLVVEETYFCRACWPDNPAPGNILPVPTRRAPKQALLGLCLVCNGSETWHGEPCWLCVEGLNGPHDPGWKGESDTARCAHCGAGGDLIAVGAGREGHAWVHKDCLPSWRANRRSLPAELLELDELDDQWGRPDLQKWVKRFGGYPNIPWGLWDRARERARMRFSEKRSGSVRFGMADRASA